MTATTAGAPPAVAAAPAKAATKAAAAPAPAATNGAGAAGATATERDAMRAFWAEHSSKPTVEAMMLDSQAAQIDCEERPEVREWAWGVLDLCVWGVGVRRNIIRPSPSLFFAAPIWRAHARDSTAAFSSSSPASPS
jgi:hypothetical protein